MTLDWKIWYDDGTTFDSSQGLPSESPVAGVICIVYPDEEIGRQIMHRWDNYYWHPIECQWWGADDWGIKERTIYNLPMESVRTGRSVSNKEYRTIMGMADKDPDFPPRSGKRSSESPRPAPGVTD